ncbi:hypothetical protein [Shouchella patagoniensis]|uniref:hypothetical protein n=1 Tax=Shouchella patagoniensis TaxID=228576 RepID=UPI000994FE25|nr:hypothetical protein [Shouchella patagoniensis]
MEDLRKSYEKRISMVNTLLGEGFEGTFEFLFDTKKEAEANAKMFRKWYDLDYFHDEEERCYKYKPGAIYNNSSIYNGISYKASYIED